MQLSTDGLCQVLEGQGIHPDLVKWVREKVYNGRLFIESGTKMVEGMRSNRQLDELHVGVFERLQQQIAKQHQEEAQRAKVKAEAEAQRRLAETRRKQLEGQRVIVGEEETAREQVLTGEAQVRDALGLQQTVGGAGILRRVQEAIRQAEEAKRAEEARQARAREEAAQKAEAEEARLAAARRPAEPTARTMAASGVKPDGRLGAQNVPALEWELGRAGSAAMPFAQAQAYVASRAAEGWRLPTIWELYTLYQQRTVLGADMEAKWFWSSTAVAGFPDNLWVVFFSSGGVSYYYVGSLHQVRLVRV